jgi:hypothetical protein
LFFCSFYSWVNEALMQSLLFLLDGAWFIL